MYVTVLTQRRPQTPCRSAGTLGTAGAALSGRPWGRSGGGSGRRTSSTPQTIRIASCPRRWSRPAGAAPSPSLGRGGHLWQIKGWLIMLLCLFDLTCYLGDMLRCGGVWQFLLCTA